MKKVYRVLAIAVLAMTMTVACNNKPAEEIEDTTAVVEEVVVEEVVEETVSNEVAEVKKEATKVEENTSDAKNVNPADAASRLKGKRVMPTKDASNVDAKDVESHMGNKRVIAQ